MYKRELEEYEEAMKTYTLNGGGVNGAAALLNVSDPAAVTGGGLSSAMSSPAQSTEMSMDFPSDPAVQHDVGSMMDEDEDMKEDEDIDDDDVEEEEDDAPLYNNNQPQQEDPIVLWQPEQQAE
jgi:non-histone protein 10